MTVAIKPSSFCHRGEHKTCATAKARCGCTCHKQKPVARKPPPRLAVVPESPEHITKELAPCCVMQRDVLGRLPIGFCGPFCIRRSMRQGETYRRALATWTDAVGPIEVAL